MLKSLTGLRELGVEKKEAKITGGKDGVELAVKQLSFVIGIGQRIRIIENWIMF